MQRLAPLLVLLCACKQDYNVIAEPVDVDPGEVTDCDFTRVDDTAFWEYDCNPVFTTTDESWAPEIGGTSFVTTQVLGHPFYQLWYVGVRVDGYGLGYAVSNNGTDWEPHPNNPQMKTPTLPTMWDRDGMDTPQVVWDPETEQYVMLYQGFNIDEVSPTNNQFGMGVATSVDGTQWTRLPLNPVLDLSEAPEGIQQYCWPLGLTLGKVTGFQGYLAGTRSGSDACEMFGLGGASITDWQASTSVVLPAGAEGEWDDRGIGSVAQAELDGVDYLFYVGFGRWEVFTGYQETRDMFVGMATSTDGGDTWIKEPGPLPLHRSNAVRSVAANTVGNRIHLWITDQYDDGQGIGYFLFDPERAAEEDG